MFSHKVPKFIPGSAYPNTCHACGGDAKVGSAIYWLSARSPANNTSKALIWHQECYEKFHQSGADFDPQTDPHRNGPTAPAPADHQGGDSTGGDDSTGGVDSPTCGGQGIPQDAQDSPQDAQDSPGDGQGSQGSDQGDSPGDGQGDPADGQDGDDSQGDTPQDPKLRDSLHRLWFNPAKLERHLHKEDLVRIGKSWSGTVDGHDVYRTPKSDLAAAFSRAVAEACDADDRGELRPGTRARVVRWERALRQVLANAHLMDSAQGDAAQQAPLHDLEGFGKLRSRRRIHMVDEKPR